MAESLGLLLISGTLTFTLLLTLVIIIIVINNRNLQRKQREAFTMVLEAIEKERYRIGQNLHDDVGPILAGMRMGQQALLNNLETNPKAIEILTKQADNLIKAMQVVRESSHELTANSIIRNGIIDAIDEQCAQINQSPKWNAILTGGYFPKNATQFCEINLFRVVSELMHNTLKHSGGSEIEIDFSQNGDKLVVTYQDDGKGIKPLPETLGLGLSGIKTRVELLQGTLEFPPAKYGFKAIITIKTAALCQTTHQ